jgi:hypothetical protein
MQVRFGNFAEKYDGLKIQFFVLDKRSLLINKILQFFGKYRL